MIFDGDLLSERARITPDKLALVVLETGERLTYADLESRARDAASALLERGIRQGDRFGILGENRPEFIALFFGGMKIGAIVVPLSTRATDHERAQIAIDCGMKEVVPLDLVERQAPRLSNGSDRRGRLSFHQSCHPPSSNPTNAGACSSATTSSAGRAANRSPSSPASRSASPVARSTRWPRSPRC
jgi:acyl-CoA synthetase (AMP-forming)/AMP-acid ligase II